MARVRLLDRDQAPLLARPHYDGNDPGPVVAALAQVPELLDAALPFLGAIYGPGAVDARTKELVVLRTSAVAACRYCVDTHTVVASDTGLSPAEITALRLESPVEETFPAPAERALLRWVDAFAADRGAVPEMVSAELATHFDDAAVVELALVAGTTLMLNRFCTALDLPTSPETLRRLADSRWSR